MADPIVSDVKYSQSTQPGDGVKTLWEFNFAGAADTPGYISKDHVKAYRTNRTTGTVTDIPITSGMWVGPNSIDVTPPVPATDDITIYRDTPKDAPLVDYTTGGIINEPNLDKSNRQSIYVAAEMVDQFLTVKDVSDLALATANTALTTSNTALDTAEDALQTSTLAVNTAAGALATAQDAVNIANNAAADTALALATAQGVDAKATQALSDSATALSTANGVDAKATSALSNSETALSTATAADTKATSALSTAASVDAKATTALSTANGADTKATTALSTANGVDAKADTALANAAAATTTANSALSASSTNATAISAETSARSAADLLLTPRDSATGGTFVPTGTTAQRPAPAGGHPVRYNTDTNQFEGYANAAWGPLVLSGDSANGVALSGAATRAFSIPTGATEVDVMFVGMQQASAGLTFLRTGGPSSVETTGYTGHAVISTDGSAPNGSAIQAGGIPIWNNSPGNSVSGMIRLRLVDRATGTWVATGTYLMNASGISYYEGTSSGFIIRGTSTALNQIVLQSGGGNFTGGTANAAWR